MKIDVYEIEKVNNALNSISGWIVDKFNLWESAKGETMATVRLKYIGNSGGNGSSSVSTVLKKE